MNLRTLPGLLAFLLALAPAVRADDWPQWRGPNRDNVSKETGLLADWPKDGPKLLWTFDAAGIGYSGPAVVGNRLFCLGGDQTNEFVVALNVANGEKVGST